MGHRERKSAIRRQIERSSTTDITHWIDNCGFRGMAISVPKSLILRRQKAYRKRVDANPNRRGPKRKSEQVEPQDITVLDI